MMNSAVTARLRLGAIALGVALLSTAPIAHAHGGGGGGGGGHGGGFGGGHGGGFGGGHGGGYGGRGGHGGYGRGDGRGGYGHRGYRGRDYGYGGFGFYDDFGLLDYGLALDALPFYYSTYWWGGVPDYYANDNFYQWNGPAVQYETVPAPQSLADKVMAQGADLNLFAYPTNGQAAEQQATDRGECQRWATSQTGIDSPPAGSTTTISVPASKRQDYLRAQAACLQGRGYSVK
jgi:hypothetical protein